MAIGQPSPLGAEHGRCDSDRGCVPDHLRERRRVTVAAVRAWKRLAAAPTALAAAAILSLPSAARVRSNAADPAHAVPAPNLQPAGCGVRRQGGLRRRRRRGRARTMAAMVTVALAASACSDGHAEQQSGSATTATTATTVAAVPPRTSETASHDRRKPVATTDAAGDQAAAVHGKDPEAQAVGTDTIAQTDADHDAGQDKHDAQQDEPTPEELEALWTALDPSMPGGGVLAGYNNYWCTLTTEGHIHCWGTTDGGTHVSQLPWPSGAYVAIDVGSDFACAVRADKALVCWGKDHYSGRELSTPDGEFDSVTVGIRDACAIRVDANVVCWRILDLHDVLPDNALAPDGKFVSVAAEGDRTCGVTSESELVCWGRIDREQDRPADGKFISVTGSCALRADRSLACWDRPSEHDSTNSSPYAIPTGEFLSVSATEDRGCAIALDGELACWGYEPRRRTREVEFWFDQYVAVAATRHSACALNVHGHISCLDFNSPADSRFGPGRFGPGRETVQLPGFDAANAVPTTDQIGAQARRIGIGDSFICMLQADAAVRCFGEFLQWYHDYNEWIEAVAPPGRFVSLVAGPNHACALTMERTALCWGPDSQERDPRWDDPVGPGAVPSGTFALLSAGESHTCGLRDDRSVECWRNGEGSLLDTPDGAYVDIAAESGHTCALREDGVIVCWTVLGEYLGKHETWQHSNPIRPYIRLASGARHYCGVREDNLLTCWWGSEGDGEFRYKSIFATFADMAVGSDHTCGLRLDGTVTCWDHDGSGHMSAPEGRFVEIYSGSDTSCAVSAQDEITCWGELSNVLWQPFEDGELQLIRTGEP